ncbi:MAG: metal ABC transporter ATP-binding protein [Nocardioidaceae bacterium]
MTNVVQVTDGSIALGGRPVLRGIDLSVRRGQVVAVLGSNGSGKSTLVRGLMGLTPWVRGDVRLFETPLGRFHDWKRVGYVPQRQTASSGVPATVTEVVAAGRLSRRKPLMPLRQADRCAVRRAIRAVELQEMQHEVVGHLSGGQQQRVLIARALAGEPELFVLDEPNAGVDRHNQLALATTLRPLVAGGTTVFVVLHEIGPLADLIDRAVVLRDGRVSYDGPPPDEQTLDGFDDHHHLNRAAEHLRLKAGWDL